MSFSFRLFHSFLSEEDKILKKALTNVLGYTPGYLPYYVTALTHRSANAETLNNERLEFLGDAFIGSIVGEYLFKKYPTQNEGYLTEMRSKIVSRQSLNSVAIKMGLQKLVRYNSHDRILKRSHIFGNALEALVGAIYLDKGYAVTNQFIKAKLIGTFLDIDELENTEFNFKNKLYTWAQKKHYSLEFTTIKESFEAGRKIFKVGVFVNNQTFIEATGYSKKEASQLAAQKALDAIELNPDINFSFQDSTPELITDTDIHSISDAEHDHMLDSNNLLEDNKDSETFIEDHKASLSDTSIELLSENNEEVIITPPDTAKDINTINHQLDENITTEQSSNDVDLPSKGNSINTTSTTLDNYSIDDDDAPTTEQQEEDKD